MKKSLLKFRQLLEEKGCEVEDIKFKFNGKVIYIGFHAVYGNTTVEVEPLYRNTWSVNTVTILPNNEDYFDRKMSFMHYAKKREGFYPPLCWPYSLMKKEILESLGLDNICISHYSRLHNKRFVFYTIDKANSFLDYIQEAEGWFDNPTLSNVEDRRLFCQKENLNLPILVK